MANMKFGYARVSTDDQELARQIDALNNYGVDKIYKEKILLPRLKIGKGGMEEEIGNGVRMML